MSDVSPFRRVVFNDRQKNGDASVPRCLPVITDYPSCAHAQRTPDSSPRYVTYDSYAWEPSHEVYREYVNSL